MFTKVIVYQKAVYIYFYNQGETPLRIPTGVQIKETPKTKKTKDGKTVKYFETFKDGLVTHHLKDFEAYNREINLVKTKVVKIISDYYNRELKKPSVDYVQDQLYKDGKAASSPGGWKGIYNDFIEYKEGKVGVSDSMKDYLSLLNALRLYEYKKKQKLSINTINSITFFSKFEKFLKSPYELTEKEFKEYRVTGNLGPYTVIKRMSSVKAFIKYCKQVGLIKENNIREESIEASRYPRTKVILEDAELLQLKNLQLEDENEIKTRNLLLFLCFTSLRYNDAMLVTRYNLFEENGAVVLKKMGQKVKNPFEIPMTPEALEIFERYNYNMHIITAQQMFNRYIKALLKKYNICCYEIPINDPKSKEGQSIIMKYTKISSHTGRRTWITRAVRAGISLDVIMAATSHKKLDTILEYMKIFGAKNHQDVITKLALE